MTTISVINYFIFSTFILSLAQASAIGAERPEPRADRGGVQQRHDVSTLTDLLRTQTLKQEVERLSEDVARRIAGSKPLLKAAAPKLRKGEAEEEQNVRLAEERSRQEALACRLSEIDLNDDGNNGSESEDEGDFEEPLSMQQTAPTIPIKFKEANQEEPKKSRCFVDLKSEIQNLIFELCTDRISELKNGYVRFNHSLGDLMKKIALMEKQVESERRAIEMACKKEFLVDVISSRDAEMIQTNHIRSIQELGVMHREYAVLLECFFNDPLIQFQIEEYAIDIFNSYDVRDRAEIKTYLARLGFGATVPLSPPKSEEID